jgi:Spy/CpxP family protein refolding chaperone
MLRIKVLVAALVFAVVVSAGSFGDDKKPAAKVKGQLPPNWSKLGLTDEQKQKVYEAQGEYREKIAELEKQIKDLRKQERTAMEKVLTDAQKARLKEILLEKAPSDK